jgi:tetratricopeptide (TPR) repeat protein
MKKFTLILAVLLVFSIVSCSEQPAKTHFEKGKQLFNQSNYDEAIKEFDEAIRLKPDMAEAYAFRARSYNRKDDYDRGLADANKAIQLNPKLAVGYYARGNNYRDMNDKDSAIANYTEAVKLDPKFALAYANRGNAYADKKDYDRAIADYTEAIKIDNNYAWMYVDRGNAYAEKKDYDRAITEYTFAIRLDPKFAIAYYNRGNAYAIKKDYDRAIENFTDAIRFDKRYIMAYNNRGKVFDIKKDYDRAIADFEAILKIDPNNSQAKDYLKIDESKSGNKNDKNATQVNSPALAQAAPAPSSAKVNPESDFEVILTDDSKGAVISKYIGKATSVIIPKTIQGMPVREIGYLAFAGKNVDRSYLIKYSEIRFIDDPSIAKITSVVIPEGVTSIGQYAFNYCENLSSVTLPSTLESIDGSAFNYCVALRTITLPTGLKKLGYGVFEGSSLTTLPNPWPSAITRIPGGSFKNSKLRVVVIPEGIAILGDESFYECKELTSISLPSTIKEIGLQAFFSCPLLTTVNIPESVKEIKFDNLSFYRCPKLNLASQAALKQRGYEQSF